MLRWIGVLAIGVVIGAGTVLLLRPAGSNPTPVPTFSHESEKTLSALPKSREVTDSGHPLSTLAEVRGLPSEFEQTASLYDLLRVADIHTIEDLLDEADLLEPREAREAKETLYARYAQFDPRAAAARIQAKGVAERRFLRFVVEVWATADVDDALAFARTLGTERRKYAATVILRARADLSRESRRQISESFSIREIFQQQQLEIDAEANPAAAWNEALGSETTQSYSAVLSRVAGRWLEQDPQALFAAIGRLSNNHIRTGLLQSMMSRWAGVDYDAALRWVLAQPESRDRPNLLAAIASRSAEHASDEMLDLARTLDGKERREIVEAVVTGMSRTDPQGALRILAEFDDPRITGTANAALRSWARSDANAALEWALAQPPSRHRSSWIATTLSAIAQKAPEDALSLAGDLEDGMAPDVVLEILWQWGIDNPKAAAAWLDTSSYRTSQTVRTLANGYARQDPEAAFEWIMTQSVETQRAAIADAVMAATNESLAIARRMVDRIRDPEAKRGAATALVRQWAQTNPRDAVRYIARLGDDQPHDLYETTFAEWAGFDRDAATAFVSQLPPSARDAARVGLISEALWYTRDFAFAERMYDNLVGEDARRRVAVQLHSQLRETDPQRAERYAPEDTKPAVFVIER